MGWHAGRARSRYVPTARVGLRFRRRSIFRTVLVSAPAVRPRAATGTPATVTCASGLVRQCPSTPVMLKIGRLPAPWPRLRRYRPGRLRCPSRQRLDRRRRRPPGPRHQVRPQHETRSIPIPPILVQMLRSHLKRYGRASPPSPASLPARPAAPRPAARGRVAGTEGRRARHRSRPPRRTQRRLAAFSPAAHEWGPPASRP
jgi:hypothetical protein